MIEDIPMDEISIHVPAWGTTSRSDSLLISMQFQSTFPRGERQCSASVSESVRHFNPRSRVGNDNSLFRFMVSYPYFNPRSRVGNDLFRNCMCAFDIISIHVPAWGTTFSPFIIEMFHVFQSTFPRGERQQILTIFRLYFCIGITNLHFTSLLLSEFFILFISFVRFFKFFMVRVSLGFSVCF